MNWTLRNPEFQAAAKLLLMQVVLAAVVFIFLSMELQAVNQTTIRQNTALMGRILTLQPELENQIIDLVTRKATKEEYTLGSQVLKQYGYADTMRMTSQPMLGNIYPALPVKGSVGILIWILPMLLLFEYRQLFSKVHRISHAAERVVEGDFSIQLPEGGEGEFGILGQHFNAMANRLNYSLEKLREDKLFLKNIISDISHQLKTPLASLIAMNDLLLEGRVEQGRVQEFLDKCRSQLNRMEWLTLNLLKLAGLEAGAIVFKQERIPLLKPVRKALSSLEVIIGEKHQSVSFKEEKGKVYFTGDEEWMAEAFVNLLKNAVEHTGKEGRISIELSETPLFSRIVIGDNGEGIVPKDLPHIFERFYKGSNSVKIECVGIGLALAKLIIEAHGGTISVESRQGTGTKFTITFLKGIL
jgi:signal transduction histidine kinase